MTQYSFVTTWRIKAPIDKVWDAIYETKRWPEWWQGVERVEELLKGDRKGKGAVMRYTWKSKLPYRLVFDMRTTRVEEPRALEGAAFGELEGSGRWELKQEGDVTAVRYYWNVRTTKAWMNLFAPVARPFFAWNHTVVMRWGGEGLSRLLNAPLLNAGEDG